VPELGRYADVSRHRTARITPGVVVYRLDDRLFFANAGYVKGRVREAIRAATGRTHTLVFDAGGLTQVDSAGIEAMRSLTRSLDADGITVLTARMRGRLEDEFRDRLAEEFPAERSFPTVRAAVASRA
jgi:SulP family sulfate permease